MKKIGFNLFAVALCTMASMVSFSANNIFLGVANAVLALINFIVVYESLPN